MQIAKTSYLKDIVSPKDINSFQKGKKSFLLVFIFSYVFKTFKNYICISRYLFM